MSGICSAHKNYDPECPRCRAGEGKMTCKFQQDLTEVEVYCSCGEILEQVERVNFKPYITVKPCRRCMEEEYKEGLSRTREL